MSGGFIFSKLNWACDSRSNQQFGDVRNLIFPGCDTHCDREVKLPDEKPTISLLLCKSAQKTIVVLTLPNVRQHHAKEPERSADSQPQAARRASATRQSALPALQGTAETKARRMERCRDWTSRSFRNSPFWPMNNAKKITEAQPAWRRPTNKSSLSKEALRCDMEEETKVLVETGAEVYRPA